MRKINSALLIIVGIAFLLRILFINLAPPSINWDEASLGYNAYSILKTGKDEWGRFLPLTFEAFGDYKLPVYIYLSVPFIAIFGLNELAIKLPSIIAGVFAIFFIFKIVKIGSKREDLALISASFLAISPWHLFLSRITLEANLSFTIFLAGIFFLLKGFTSKVYFFPAAILLGLTIFTYNSARIFTPLFILFTGIFYLREIKSHIKELILPGTLLGVFLIVAGYLAVFEDSSSRYYWVSIVDQGAINYLNESRATSPLPEIFTNLIYNRYTYFFQNLLLNYLSHFSLEFLFLEGGSHYQFSLPHNGLLLLAELPLVLFGLINIRKLKKISKLVLIWLMVAPLASAVTREAPHALRAIFMLGATSTISAVGFVSLKDKIAEKKLLIFRNFTLIFGAILAVNLVIFLYQYLFIYPRSYSSSWQYGNKEIVEIIKMQSSNRKIYYTKRYGEPHIFYLFFTSYDPGRYQSNPTLIRYSRTNWRWVDRLDNIYFINDWEVVKNLKDEKNALLITSPENYPKNSKVLRSIYFKDGSKAFDVVEL